MNNITMEEAAFVAAYLESDIDAIRPIQFLFSITPLDGTMRGKTFQMFGRFEDITGHGDIRFGSDMWHESQSGNLFFDCDKYYVLWPFAGNIKANIEIAN